MTTCCGSKPSSRRTRSRCSFGVQERLDVHAAVDRRELFARRDAGCHHQVGHGVGHADQVVAAAGGVALAPAIELAPRPRIERTERCAMDGVHDRRHAQRPRREPAEDAGLGAVRVDDIRAELSQHLLESRYARQSRSG